MSDDVAAAGARRTVAPGVDQLAVRSPTLPPFATTWLTLVRSGARGLLIDPGFVDPDDVRDVLHWARSRGASDVDRILLTHTHRDHVAGLEPLARALGDVPVHVHPAERAHLPASVRSVPLADGRVLVIGGATLRAHHTPGHAPGHLVFEIAPADDPHAEVGPPGVVAGDLLTGRGAPWIGLPDGDVDAYLDSVAKVRSLRPAWIATAHGARPDDPDAALADAAEHRTARREATWKVLSQARSLDAIREAVYGPAPESMTARLRAATLANLLSLMRARRVVHLGDDEHGPYLRAPGSG